MKKLLAKLKFNKKNKGFSLLEVMLAICILALIATPIFNTIMVSYKLNLKSRKTLAATDIVTATMEYASNKTIKKFTYKASEPDPSDSTKTVSVDIEVLGLEDIYNGDGAKLKVAGTGMYKLFPDSNYEAASYAKNSGKSTFSDVEYNGYHFDVVVSYNLPASTALYYTGTFKVEIYDHTEVDDSGNKIKYTEASTQVANTL